MVEDIQMPKDEPPKAAWMVTFTDLVSLMLTFFVLLFSMSSLQMDEWDAMIDTLTQSLNPGKVSTVAAATAEFNIGTIFRRQATTWITCPRCWKKAFCKMNCWRPAASCCWKTAW